MVVTAVRKQDTVLSGGFGKSTNAARSGFLPICLDRVPLSAMQGIAVYLRQAIGAEKKETFTLFCAHNIPFTQRHVERLAEGGVKFIYIAMAQQAQFREQTEARLLETADDPSMAVSVKSEIIYETSVELVNELLNEPDLASKSPRLEKVSRAVTTLVLNDPTAFSHLFAASHHDFYTATHMVNVATWMVPLAYSMGHHDIEELNQICQAGLLHDIGKTYVSAEILNKKGRLLPEEWAEIQTHPELGCKHLAQYERIHPLISTVTLEHHERMDGSGYPRKIKGDQMHPISRICAVVDSFDAMTAFRPFKDRTLSVDDAMEIIKSETPLKYDPKVVEAWVGLMQSAAKTTAPQAEAGNAGLTRRAFQRFPINCPARLHVLEPAGDTWVERLGMQTVAHNVSQAGLGMLSQNRVSPGEHVRVHMLGQGTLRRTHEGLVVRCREYKDGWFEIGMKTAPLIPEKQVEIMAAVKS